MKKWLPLLLIAGLLIACQSEKTIDKDDNKPVFEEATIIHHMEDFEATPFVDLPDEQKMTIDRRVLTHEMIFYGDHEVITSTNEQTVLFDVQTDEPKWALDIGGYSVYQTVRDGLYYVPSREGVKAISLATGEIEHTYTNDNPIKAHTAFIYDAYVLTAHLEEIAVYDKNNGNLLWHHPVDDMIVTPIELDNAFLVKVDDDDITAFDKDTGEIINTLDGKQDMYKQGFLLDEQIIVFNEDPEALNPIYLDVFDKHTFNHINHFELLRTGLKPIITDNELYIFEPFEGTIAVDSSLKKERWRLDGTDITYDFIDYTADDRGLHILIQKQDHDDSTFYLYLDAEDGSVIQYVELDGIYERDITYNFYTHDGKIYIKLVHNGKNIYYILAPDNVHMPF